MRIEKWQRFCPLCGTHATVIENKISEIECPNCGKFNIDLSAYPLIFEKEYRNEIILHYFADMMALNKSDDKKKIDFEIYKEIEKKLFCNS